MAFNIGGRTISFEEYSRLSTLTPRPRLPLRTAHPPAVSIIDPESPRKCGTSLTNKLWLRICVACGVLRDIPIPSGDCLVSLRPGRSVQTWLNQTGCWNIRGRLVAAPFFDPEYPAFTSLRSAARYSFGQGAGSRLQPLAKHSGDGSERTVGTGPGSGENRGQDFPALCGKCHHWGFVTACDRKARYK
ncbi:hypothetical protein FHX09_005599 [Rhizobium sp. BK538]|nr:hypothetical protein [Rhizobium sp. BK538]